MASRGGARLGKAGQSKAGEVVFQSRPKGVTNMATREARESELRRIYERDGCVRVSVVVKEANPKRSPLHDEFEWDDQVAGHEYRLSQARKLIRVVAIADKTGARSRLVHVAPESIDGPTAVIQRREGVYKPIQVVAQEPAEYGRALRELYNQRNAMDAAIRELKRAAKSAGKEVDLLPQLEDGLRIVKNTLRLMMQNAA